MLMFRPTITQLRIAIVVLNLVVTALVGVLPVYRSFYRHERVRQHDAEKWTRKDPGDYEFKGTGNNRSRRLLELVSSLGYAFAKDPPPPPPKTPDTTAETDVESVPAEGDEEVLDPGPLADKWEFTGGIFVGYNSEENMAILQKKESEQPVSRRKTVIRRASSSRARTSSRRSRTLRASPSDSKLLRVYDRWVVDEQEGPAVFVIKVTPDEFVYEVQGTWGRYALKRKRDTIYEYDPESGIAVTPPVREDEDENDGGDGTGEEKKKFFYVNKELPSLREDFERRREKYADPYTPPADAGGGASSSSRSLGGLRRSSVRPLSGSRSPARPKPPTKEELRELKKTIKKIPAGKRKELNDALNKAMRKR